MVQLERFLGEKIVDCACGARAFETTLTWADGALSRTTELGALHQSV